VRQRLIFEVADDELNLGVLAMLGIDERRRVAAVGEECEVTPVAEQLGLLILCVQVDAANDQAL
jgi:hypothetical protein